MATKETRAQRGRRRARELTNRAVAELREARLAAGLSQAQLGRELGLDGSNVWRLESRETTDVSISRISGLASVLGHKALLPGAGDRRAWDKLLRLVGASPPYRVAVEIETRVTDIQALVRRTRGRERDGGADAILIVLAGTPHNRRLVVDEVRAWLGVDYGTQPRHVLSALRSGQRLVGSGVVLI